MVLQGLRGLGPRTQVRLGAQPLGVQPGELEARAQLRHALVYCLGQCFCLGLVLCLRARPICSQQVAGLEGAWPLAPVHRPCPKLVEGPGQVR